MRTTTVDNEFRNQLRLEVLKLQREQRTMDRIHQLQTVAAIVSLFNLQPSIEYLNGGWVLCFNEANATKLAELLTQHVLETFGDTNEKERT